MRTTDHTGTTVVHIDGERALRLLLDVVTEHGAEHVYIYHPGGHLSCRYVWDGCPDCLVGRALHLAGVPVHALQQLDADPDTCAIGQADVVGAEFTGEARWILSAAQGRQDSGDRWGDAVGKAAATAEQLGVDPSVVDDVRRGLDALRGGRS